MTGGYSVYGLCWSCKQPFHFNPHLVPSIPIEGVLQQVCRTCVERANKARSLLGNVLPQIEIPEGAYDSVTETLD